MNYKEIAKEIIEIVNKQDSLYDAVDLVEEFLKKMVDPKTILLTKNDKEKFFDAIFDENKDTPKIGRIIYSEIKENDHSVIRNTDDMSIDEQIEYIKGLFEFEEDKTVMNEMIKELLNQNKDE